MPTVVGLIGVRLSWRPLRPFGAYYWGLLQPDGGNSEFGGCPVEVEPRSL